MKRVERFGSGGTSLDQFGLLSGKELSPRSRTARRFAPAPEPPGASRRNRNSLARLRRASASSDWSLLFCERGESPLSHIPPKTRAANGVRCRQFFRAWLTAADTRWRTGKTTPPPYRHGDAQARERRPPVGTARRRRAAVKDPENEVRCRWFFSRMANRRRHKVARRQDNADPLPARRRAGKGTPTSGRHSPPQAGGSEGPRERSSLPLVFFALG